MVQKRRRMDTGERRKRCLSVADRHTLPILRIQEFRSQKAVAIIAITRFEQKPLPNRLSGIEYSCMVTEERTKKMEKR